MKDDKFTNSAAYIKAVFNNQSPGGSPSPMKHPGLPDYSKYLKRYEYQEVRPVPTTHPNHFCSMQTVQKPKGN